MLQIVYKTFHIPTCEISIQNMDLVAVITFYILCRVSYCVKLIIHLFSDALI